jgi:hypothetical protein
VESNGGSLAMQPDRGLRPGARRNRDVIAPEMLGE